MNQDTVVGSAKSLGGKVQQGVGRITDDVKTQAEGVVNQAAGAAQELYGQAKEGAQDAAKAVQQGAADMEDYIRQAVEKRPYTTAFVALCVGLVLGRMGDRD
jgi:uncharacterized protein YjbJ (UPF0337 family)